MKNLVPNLFELRYTIVDTSEGAVLLHLNSETVGMVKTLENHFFWVLNCCVGSECSSPSVAASTSIFTFANFEESTNQGQPQK